MRRILLLIITFFALHAYAAPLEERQNLDPVGSFFSSVFLPDATTTSDNQPAASTTTEDPKATTPDPKATKGPKAKSTTSELTIAAPTSTTSLTTSSTTSSTASSSTQSSSSSSSSTTSLASSTPVPTSPVTGAQTSPTQSNNGSSSGISSAGIAIAVIMSLAVAIAAFVVIWKFYGPVVRWREKREYERMQERSYRPTLDGPFQNDSQEKGLGISSANRMNRASVMSFLALAKPKHQIKRKPVPGSPVTPVSGTSGSGTGVSPLMPGPPRLPSIASSRTEKNLPSIPEGVQ